MKSQPDTQEEPRVPKLQVLAWSAPWITLLALLFFIGSVGDVKVSHSTYVFWRSVGLTVMVILAVYGVLRALQLIGKKTIEPWYTIGLLVALVLFWGLFPPAWFFVEYLLVDRGVFQMPIKLQGAYEELAKASNLQEAEEIRKSYLASVKAYADMASKVWISVGAALATTIGFARK
jgi:hypothetical protein